MRSGRNSRRLIALCVCVYVCVCALPAATGMWTYVQAGGSVDALSDRDSYWWVMVCTGRVACVCVSSFGEGLAVWVLLPRVDRGRRADRIGIRLTELVQV